MRRQNEILEIFRKSLANSGVYGIFRITKTFKVLDNNMDNTISATEF